MTVPDPPFDQLLRAFYARSRVDPETAARLAALALVDQPAVAPVAPRSRPSLRRGVMTGTLLLLCGIAIGRYCLQRDRSQPIVVASHQTDAAERARLVAVRYQVDWCPRSQATERVFADLVLRYGNTPLQFVVYNMTDDAERAASAKMAKRVGIDWIPMVRNGMSGKVLLVDADHQRVLATLATPDARDGWVAALDRALER